MLSRSLKRTPHLAIIVTFAMCVCETKWVQTDSGHAQRPPARTEYLIFLAVRDQDEI
jgi:hypothetical protein